jgi:hypothetical protein
MSGECSVEYSHTKVLVPNHIGIFVLVPTHRNIYRQYRHFQFSTGVYAGNEYTQVKRDTVTMCGTKYIFTSQRN